MRIDATRRQPRLFALTIAATSGLLLSAPIEQARAAEAWPAHVRALYDIEFNGINVGSFEFNSSAEGNTYNLTGYAKLSALLGAFHWKGQTNSSGQIVGEAPKPQAFAFDFKSNSKSGSTRMGFGDGGVTSLVNEPPVREKAGVVPVREQHLRGVLDPLAAVLALARPAGPNPCTRQLAIFDGKQRFDLQLSHRGQMRIAERRPSGQPAMAYVCRVKYVPIAGHKADEANSQLVNEDQIEIALRPIPSANLFIPYQITIPTVAGPARMIAKRVDIVGPGGSQQIALIY